MVRRRPKERLVGLPPDPRVCMMLSLKKERLTGLPSNPRVRMMLILEKNIKKKEKDQTGTVVKCVPVC